MVNSILAQQGPTPNKVVKVLSVSKDDLTSSETSVLYYLKTFIRSLDRSVCFIIYVTGSLLMPNKIKV